MNLSQADICAIAEAVASRMEAIPGEWLTLDEAMTYARISSPNTMRKMLLDGVIYGKKVGGKWIVSRSSIDDFYNSERF